MEKLFNKRVKRKILLFFLPPLAYGFIRLLYMSCKKNFHFPQNRVNVPCLVAFWHGEILMNPFLHQKFLKDAKMSVMISDHFDGEFIAKIAHYFGFSVIRGSSTRGAIKALKKSFKLIDDGGGIAITPDGPRGPFHSIADGIVIMAQRKDIPIVVYRYKATSFWRLNSWDKFIIPKPFSRLDFYVSEPIYVNGLSMFDAKEKIKEKLDSYV